VSKDTLENFKKSWEGEIAKIEKEAIDSHGVHAIYLRFDLSKHLFIMGLNENEFTHDIHLELEMLTAKIARALETARSRYRLKNRGLWARIVEGIGGIIYKIPKK